MKSVSKSKSCRKTSVLFACMGALPGERKNPIQIGTFTQKVDKCKLQKACMHDMKDRNWLTGEAHYDGL